jgi:hypothetical protein
MAKRKKTYDPDAQRAYRERELAAGREEFLMKLDGDDADNLRSAMSRFDLDTRQKAVKYALAKLAESANTPKPRKGQKR